MKTQSTTFKLTQAHILREYDDGHPDEGGDGYWIELNRGWKSAGDSIGAVHAIHEDTRSAARSERVLPCNCEACK
jgi:hypothetical protein